VLDYQYSNATGRCFILLFLWENYVLPYSKEAQSVLALWGDKKKEWFQILDSVSEVSPDDADLELTHPGADV